MNKIGDPGAAGRPISADQAMARVNASLRKRYGAERRFRIYGIASVFVGLAFLALMMISIVGKGYTAFQQTYVDLDIYFDPARDRPGRSARSGNPDAGELQHPDQGLAAVPVSPKPRDARSAGHWAP